MNESSVIRLVRDFGLALDTERYRILISRQGAGFRVATIGLVSRGKSTLVNRLAGIALCPVDARAETIANVAISSGAPYARAWIATGDEVAIPSDAGGFSARLPRRVAPAVTMAEFRGQTRLPDGVTIVDTPGIGDADMDSTKFGELDSRWTATGAMAAVLVLAYPPGFGRNDRQLLEAAQRAFGNALVPVLKATDSEVEADELAQVAEVILGQTGLEPIVLYDSQEMAPWGAGPLGEVERRILGMVPLAQGLAARDAEEIDDIHRLIAFALGQRGATERGRLASLDATYPGLPPIVSAAAKRRVDLLDVEAARSVQQAAEQQQARRQEFLDAQAADLERLLTPTSRGGADDRAQSRVIRELLQLAVEGSASALSIVVPRIPERPEDRSRVGVGLASIIGTTPESFWLRLVGSKELSRDEFYASVGRAGVASTAAGLEVIRAHCGRPSVSSEEIKAAAGRAKHDSIHVLLEDGYRNKVIAELTQSVTRAVDPVSCAVAVQGFDAFDKMLTRGAFAAPVTNGQRRTLMEARESLVASLRGQIMALLQALERDLLSKAIDVSSKDIRRVTTQVHDLSVWALRAEDEESVRLARLFTPGGALEHWARRCEDQRFEAGTAAERANVIWGLLYLASFAVWGVSLLLLRENIKVAVGVWVGSFVLWLVTRDHRDTPTTWKDKFRPPTPPIVPRSVR